MSATDRADSGPCTGGWKCTAAEHIEGCLSGDGVQAARVQEEHGPCGGGPWLGIHGGPEDRHCLVCTDKACRYNQPDDYALSPEPFVPVPLWALIKARHDHRAACPACAGRDGDGSNCTDPWYAEALVGCRQVGHPITCPATRTSDDR